MTARFFDETLGILGHAEFLEPVSNCLHGGQRSRWYDRDTAIATQSHC
jgi:hypothetical protein